MASKTWRDDRTGMEFRDSGRLGLWVSHGRIYKRPVSTGWTAWMWLGELLRAGLRFDLGLILRVTLVAVPLVVVVAVVVAAVRVFFTVGGVR